MVRTQIQLPDEVYSRARQVAEAKEISLAELARRGLELILAQYPPPHEMRKPWRLPVVQGLGWKDLSHEQLKDAAQKSEIEEEMEIRTRDHARV
jgi:hypothetical protein